MLYIICCFFEALFYAFEGFFYALGLYFFRVYLFFSGKKFDFLDYSNYNLF